MHEPPDSLWEVNRALQFDDPLDGDRDPRWVDTEAARGQYSHRPLYRTLGVSQAKALMGDPPDRGYYLFCGHRGCGKSTELRRIRHQLHDNDRYYVVFSDATRELDVNNLRYQDVLLHLAGRLASRLKDDGIAVDSAHLERLRSWFDQRVEKREETREFAEQARMGIKGETGIPLIVKIFGEISGALRTNSTYKEELRRTLRNYFSDFADAFNQFIEASASAVRAVRSGRQILFVVDGTDRLRDSDARAFFLADVHQLQQVRSLFIYCAPIHLRYEEGTTAQGFTNTFQLPMIKIENADGSRNTEGYDAMREMLHRRAANQLFEDGVADYLIRYSGGHPRDLLRLVQIAFSFEEGSRFSLDSTKRAVRQLASDYRRILNSEDYELLAAVDKSPSDPSHSDRARHLLYNLALLEYNDYYWRSHPVIRTTESYRRMRSEALQSPDE